METKFNEEDLLEQLRNPDTQRSGFARLVKQYSERLYWQIRKMVYSHEDANDILQDVFIKAWLNIENFRGDAKLSTWLYKIAINESITFINKSKAKQNLSIDDDDSFLINQLESDKYFDGDEAQLLLQKAVVTLPEKQRLVFQMKYFSEMKYDEISEVLGTSVGALKASYHHAVKKVESFLKESH
ncbi:MAG: RNA polymerase sigma factor [Candidatus Saccharimonadaceae bacterium]